MKIGDLRLPRLRVLGLIDGKGQLSLAGEIGDMP